jgi:hypothetical protein
VECLNSAHALYLQEGVRDHLCALRLCIAHWSLSFVKTNRSDLDQSVASGLLALELCGPCHRDFYWAKWCTSNAQLTRIRNYNADASETLDRIADSLREAHARAPRGWRIELTEMLGYALQMWFRQQGREEDLTDIISITKATLADIDPSNSQWTCRIQARFSSAVYNRFGLTGLPEDIEAAASAAYQAASKNRTGAHQIAICRNLQYSAFGDLTHLNECIVLLEQLMEHYPSESIEGREVAANLLVSLHMRHQAKGDTGDLDRAIELISAATRGLSEKDSDLPMILHYGGTAFLSRFKVTSASEDLEQATILLGSAAQDFPHNGHEWHVRIGAYTKILRVRCETLHEQDGMTKARQLHAQVISSLPRTHSDRAQALCGWAGLLLCDTVDATMAEGLDALLEALDNSYCPAYKRLKEASDVLTHVSNNIQPHIQLRNTLQLSTVYSTAIALLPEVASFGLDLSARLSVMAGAGQLTMQGATHAISTHQLDVALEMLEAGRNVFWTQNLQLRTSFTQLPSALGDRLTKITYALARPFPSDLQGPRKDGELVRRRQLGGQFKSVLNEARSIAGFEDLLRNKPFASLS